MSVIACMVLLWFDIDSSMNMHRRIVFIGVISQWIILDLMIGFDIELAKNRKIWIVNNLYQILGQHTFKFNFCLLLLASIKYDAEPWFIE